MPRYPLGIMSGLELTNVGLVRASLVAAASDGRSP